MGMNVNLTPQLDALVRSKVSSGMYVAPVKLTVSEYLDRWLIDIRPTIKGKTYSGYEQNVRNYLKPALGKFQLQALKPNMLGRAFADLAEHGGVIE